MNANAIELFGTFASLVIAASLMMRNVKWLRIVNMVGSLFFALYGLAIHSMPVFLVNCFCVGIDAWQLRAMRHSADVFSLLRVKLDDSEYLKNFISFYKNDIKKYSPEFDAAAAAGAEAEFILRDAVPAAVVLYRKRDEHSFDVLLDFAIPAYRDYRNAEYFFSSASRAIAGGQKAELYEKASDPAQVNYLKRLGFAECGSREGGEDGKAAVREYVKTIQP